MDDFYIEEHLMELKEALFIQDEDLQEEYDFWICIPDSVVFERCGQKRRRIKK